jgi:predicted NBD/HSP70 family sugar kinase
MKQTGINMETVKKQNRASIFNFMNERGPISKKDIASELGLTPPAVTQICARFIEQGMLIEKGTLTEGVRAGRKKVLIDINYDYAYVFGININREKTVIALTNLKGEIKSIREIATNRRQEPELFLQQVAMQCKEMQAEVSLMDTQIAGVGIGICGVIEQESVRRSMCCGIWEEKVAVANLLESFLDIPVILENNITAFALAECMYGAGKERGTLLFIRWDSSLESVVIVDRNSVKNRNGNLAGVEHLVVDKFGELCCCGKKGCLETKVSFPAIKNEIEQYFSYEDTPMLYELVGGDLRNLTFDLLVRNQHKLDDVIVKLILNKIDLLAQTVVNAIELLSPDGIVLCGTVFENPENRRKLTQACILYDAKFQESQLIYTKLEDRQMYIGPVALSVNAYLEGLTV